LLVAERLPEFPLAIQAILPPRLMDRVGEVARLRCSLAHGCLRPLQPSLGPLAVAIDDGDAKGRPQPEVLAVAVGTREQLFQAPAHGEAVVGVIDPGLNDAEGTLAETCDTIGAPQVAEQFSGDQLQDLAVRAGASAPGAVERVEGDRHDPRHPTVPLRAFDRLAQAVDKQDPVRETGDRVVDWPHIRRRAGHCVRMTGAVAGDGAPGRWIEDEIGHGRCPWRFEAQAGMDR
jgi:hypothetical protein